MKRRVDWRREHITWTDNQLQRVIFSDESPFVFRSMEVNAFDAELVRGIYRAIQSELSIMTPRLWFGGVSHIMGLVIYTYCRYFHW